MELLSLPLRPLTPPGGWLVGCLQLTRGWRRRSRSGGKAGGRAVDGVRRPGGSPSGAGGAAGLLLRAVARLLRPAQVDDAQCALLPPLPNGARHSPALVCAGEPTAWRLRPPAGTTGTSGRLEGARSTWGCALRAALDVICLVHVCKMRTICAARARRRLGRDKPLTSRCSVQRVAVRRGGDLALALGESYVRGCRGSGDFKAWWWADPRLRAI